MKSNKIIEDIDKGILKTDKSIKAYSLAFKILAGATFASMGLGVAAWAFSSLACLKTLAFVVPLSGLLATKIVGDIVSVKRFNLKILKQEKEILSKDYNENVNETSEGQAESIENE